MLLSSGEPAGSSAFCEAGGGLLDALDGGLLDWADLNGAVEGVLLAARDKEALPGMTVEVAILAEVLVPRACQKLKYPKLGRD